MKKLLFGLVASCLTVVMAAPASAMPVSVSSGSVTAPAGSVTIAPVTLQAAGPGTFDVSLRGIVPTTNPYSVTFDVEGFSTSFNLPSFATMFTSTFSIDAATMAGFDLTDGVTFTFASLGLTPGSGSFSGTLNYNAAPEPSTAALACIGVVVGGVFYRRRKVTLA